MVQSETMSKTSAKEQVTHHAPDVLSLFLEVGVYSWVVVLSRHDQTIVLFHPHSVAQREVT